MSKDNKTDEVDFDGKRYKYECQNPPKFYAITPTKRVPDSLKEVRVNKLSLSTLSPEFAGAHNITEEYIMANKSDSPQDKKLASTMRELFSISMEHALKGRRTNWTPKTLAVEVSNYFKFCEAKDLKPSHSSLGAFLGISKGTLQRWMHDGFRDNNTLSSKGNNTKPDTFTDVSIILQMASDIIESEYINKAEKYPTANVFLLKTSHGHIEKSKLDITTDGNSITSSENVKELVANLGLETSK